MCQLVDFKGWGRILRRHHIWVGILRKGGTIGFIIGYNLYMMRNINSLQPRSKVVHLYTVSDLLIKTTNKAFLEEFIK
jgi:hypothetical protein